MDLEEKKHSKLVILRATEKTLLDRSEACRLLGIERGTMRALTLTGCGVASLKVRNVTLYRREDVLALRARWLATVDVDERGRTTRHLQRNGDKNSAGVDPLMMLLAHRAVVHKLVLLLFWSMILFGGALCLLLY